MEQLEKREVLSYYITQGGFGYGILDSEAWTFQTQQSPIFYLTDQNDEITILANIELHTKGGNDKITLLNQATVFSEDGNDTIIGSQYSDWIYGGAGEDVCIGGEGVDNVFGGDGDDLVVGGWAEGQNWVGNRSTRVIEALKGQITGGGDNLDGGTGFNLLYNTSPQFTYDVVKTNIAYAGSLTELNGALSTQADTIYLTGDITGTVLVNRAVSIIGNNHTIFGKMKVNSPGFYLADVKIDINGQAPFPEGPLNYFRGNNVLNNVEVYGQNLTNTASLYFPNMGAISQNIMLNCYVHDVYGDGISTAGYGSSSEVNTQSRLELFNVRGERTGPNQNNQVLTAHAGFNVVDVLGNYSDAALNVISPDNIARIDLYWTRISAGARQAGLNIVVPTTIFSCTLLDQTRITQIGNMENCYIEGEGGSILIDTYGTFKQNRVKRITGTTPVRAYSGSVVDNVFENWNYPIINLGANVSGNIFI